jgi:DMSO reductase family type II enzyme heme b subunit
MRTRFAPARAVGNFMAGDGEHAVQDLIAEGPGTLAPAKARSSEGRGRYTGVTWDVVITRPLPARSSSGRTQIAFAVWQGRLQEVGARKMRSVWTPFASEGAK